uniref:CPXV008 protein n=1 Tax=Heterorhabditis bacteriophora TaxID=37862 RepID=A0A1I7X498_HETBA
MAAACARRDVIYYTFNDLNFENSLDRVYRELIKRRITIGELYRYLVTYQSNCDDKVSVFDYVMNQMNINST